MTTSSQNDKEALTMRRLIRRSIPHGYVATSQAIADTVHLLVTKEVGVERYLVYGEDVGAPVSQWLAATRPESVRGIHDTHAAFAPRDDLRSEEERAFYRWFDAQWDGTMGYAGAGNARHDTIAASLADSPAGLAAWMVEKFRDWSDCHGDVESRFDKDALLTTVTLYWLTDTFVSSYRPTSPASSSLPRRSSPCRQRSRCSVTSGGIRARLPSVPTAISAGFR
jgi:pimeloyl-ACP methyl ester carboxylesterase